MRRGHSPYRPLCQAGWLTPDLAGSGPGQLRAAHGILKAALGGPLSLAVRQRVGVVGPKRARSQFQKIFQLKSIGDAFAATLQPFAGTEPAWGELVKWMAINYVGNMASAIAVGLAWRHGAADLS